MAELNTQITSLATNLQRVQSQGGQFVDDQGELVGAALRNSFKGKVVKMLVDRGIAREGNLGGRVAVALVGQENFDRLRTSAQELSSTSVCNVLRLLEQLESEGLDSDLKSQVSDTLYSKFSASTPISELNEAALQTLHRTIQDEVLPQRRAYRQGLLAAVDAGHPTPAMQNASQAALLVAGRGLEEKLEQAPNLTYKLDQLLEAETLQTTTGQGRSVSAGAASLLHEYQAVSAHLKSGLEGEIRQLERQITEAGAQTDPTQVAGQELQLSQRKRELSQVDDTLRQRFIGALQQTYATNDIVDGLHVGGPEGVEQKEALFRAEPNKGILKGGKLFNRAPKGTGPWAEWADSFLANDLKQGTLAGTTGKSGSTPISELNEAALQTLHETIQDEVLPQRLSRRQKLDMVDAGHPTPAMQNASQAALVVACRGLEEKIDQAPSLVYALDQLIEEEEFQTTTGQGRSVYEGAIPLLYEYKTVSAHLKSGLEGEIRQLERQIAEADAQTDPTRVASRELQLSQRKRQLSQVDDTLRQQYIGVLQQTYAANDIEDGLHVRQDGQRAFAGGELSRERVEQVRFQGKKPPVRFGGPGGVEQKEALSATTGNWASNFAQDLDEAVARGDPGEILNYARTLTDIIHGPQYSAADKRTAHMLKQNAAFLNDFDCVKEVLGGGKGWWFDQETTDIYKLNAEQLKAVIENKIRESDTLIADPESHPDYADYQDAFSDPRVGRGLRKIDRAPVDETRIIPEEEMGAGGRFRPERGGGENPTPIDGRIDGRTQIIREAEEIRAIARGLLRLPVFKT